MNKAIYLLFFCAASIHTSSLYRSSAKRQRLFAAPTQKPQQCPLAFISRAIPPAYPFEIHTTTTEDGYILTLFRIQKKNTQITGNKPAAYLQHGLNNGGSIWLQDGEKLGLAFILANAGYDVWIGNNRGTRYSRTKGKYAPTDKAFWDFSFDELAKYDVPANIAAIRETTGQDKIIYIGHSQGTSQMFAALSDAEIRPKVAPFIKQFNALAPIVFLNQPQGGTAQELADLTKAQVQKACVAKGVNFISVGTCVWDQNFIDYWNNKCRVPSAECLAQVKGENVGPNTNKIDNWSRDGYFRVFPYSGTSCQCLLHYAQLAEKQIKAPNTFPKYDFGPAGNLKKYGTKTAPNYDLSLIKEKVRMWVGTADVLATIPEAQGIKRLAINADIEYTLFQDWGHETFHFAADNSKQYGELLASLKQN